MKRKRIVSVGCCAILAACSSSVTGTTAGTSTGLAASSAGATSSGTSSAGSTSGSGTTGSGTTSTSSTSSGGGPLTAAQFVNQYYAAQCDLLSACQLRAAYMLDGGCPSSEDQMQWAQVPEELDAGLLTFNPAAAAFCIGSILDAGCNQYALLNAPSDTNWPPPVGCSQAFTGAVADGGECFRGYSSPSASLITIGVDDCAAGYTCVESGDCTGVCEGSGPPTAWTPGNCSPTTCSSGQLCQPSFLDGGGYTCLPDPLALPGDGGNCLQILPTLYAPSYLCAAGLFCSSASGSCSNPGDCICEPQVAPGATCQQTLQGPICSGTDVCAGAVWGAASAAGVCSPPADVGGPCTPASTVSGAYTVTGCIDGLDCVGTSGSATCQVPPTSGACVASADSSTDSSCETLDHYCGPDDNCHPLIAPGESCTPFAIDPVNGVVDYLNECQGGAFCAVLDAGGGLCSTDVESACFYLP